MKSYGPYLSALSLITQEQEKVLFSVHHISCFNLIPLGRGANGQRCRRGVEPEKQRHSRHSGTLCEGVFCVLTTLQIWGEQQQYISNACGGCNWYNVINSTDTDAAEAQMNKICARGGSFFNQVSLPLFALCLGSVVPDLLGGPLERKLRLSERRRLRTAVRSVYAARSGGGGISVATGTASQRVFRTAGHHRGRVVHVKLDKLYAVVRPQDVAESD